MPTYQYACTACEHQFEAVQKFSDDALTECPECTGRLRKVFSAVGVVFKGSGFYRNDSRADGKKSSTPAPAGSGSDSAASSSSDNSSSSSDSSSSSSAPKKETSSAAPAKSGGGESAA